MRSPPELRFKLIACTEPENSYLRGKIIDAGAPNGMDLPFLFFCYSMSMFVEVAGEKPCR